MEKKKIILPTKRFFKASDEDLSLKIKLDETEALLRQGDRDIILDISTQFETERRESNNYKIHGKLKMVFRNLYSGTTSFNPLLRKLYLSNDGIGIASGFLPYNEFAFLRNDVVREINTPLQGSDLTSFSQQLTLSEQPEHTLITSITAPYQNWNIYMSYISGQDSDFKIDYTLSGGTTGTTYSATAKDGIPFRILSEGNYYSFTSPVEHGISAGEYVTLSTTGNTFYVPSGTGYTTTTSLSGRTFYVESVGNATHNSEKYVLNILKSEFVVGTILGTVVFGKRCIDKDNITDTISEYYVHKHKTLTSNSGYILDKAGFENSIWEDERKILFENALGDNDVIVERNRMESLIYDFKEPLVLTGITNNLGYTPTDVYITVVLKNGNGYFNYPPKVGYKFNFHNTWVDNHFNGNTSIETGITTTTISSNSTGYTFTGGTSLPIGTILTGAFVEYNNSEMKERIVSESFHKFTARVDLFNHGQTGSTVNFSGVTITNQSGLYYQPHYRVKLKQLSPYIETSNTDDIFNLPENCKYFENEGLWKWKDVYDPGFIDLDGYGVDYPFINNIHYVKNDINFYLRNEEFYRNKTDGITSFNNKPSGLNTTDC
jgi:hypothetical protein